MAHYDKMMERNYLTKNEKKIKFTVNLFLALTLVDFLTIVIKPIRNYHFENFPNMHLIGVVLLFIIVVVRIYQANNEGKDPYMESSKVWRERKDMLGPYDCIGPGSDYSNKKHNIIYFSGVLLSLGLIIAKIIVVFFAQ